MGDFACFGLYFEVKAFKRPAESFLASGFVWDLTKKIQPSYPDIC
jgi:hypothetical protein